MRFPERKRFAFTILDDTDDSTLENVAPVYDLLRELGLRTTKTVWPVDCPEGSKNYFAADTLQRSEYLEFVKHLVADGFELAFHGATMETSPRDRTIQALAFLEREFGRIPRLHANHGENLENLYWGHARFQSPVVRALVRLVGRGRQRPFAGERPESPYYWGDHFERSFEYLRNFTFDTLDAMKFNPDMPYRLGTTPHVSGWFSTSDAPDAQAFARLVTPERLDSLEKNEGVCIISTHLGKGYVRNGRVDPIVEERLRHVAAKPGWFVPVSTLLDHLRTQQVDGAAMKPIDDLSLARLELRFLLTQLRARLRGE